MPIWVGTENQKKMELFYVCIYTYTLLKYLTNSIFLRFIFNLMLLLFYVYIFLCIHISSNSLLFLPNSFFYSLLIDCHNFQILFLCYFYIFALPNFSTLLFSKICCRCTNLLAEALRHVTKFLRCIVSKLRVEIFARASHTHIDLLTYKLWNKKKLCSRVFL